MDKPAETTNSDHLKLGSFSRLQDEISQRSTHSNLYIPFRINIDFHGYVLKILLRTLAIRAASNRMAATSPTCLISCVCALYVVV